MNEHVLEVKDTKFLANTEKLFPLPSSGGYDRLHRSWRKTVTGLNSESRPPEPTRYTPDGVALVSGIRRPLRRA
jgi:hypothetical protein